MQITTRILSLKEKTMNTDRYASIEQAKIITDCYKEHAGKSKIMQRAFSLKAALENLEITVDQEELIVGNRSKGIRAGIIFPESGCNWVEKEMDSLYTRPQDKFHIRDQDKQLFREEIFPFWHGKSMEDGIDEAYGKELTAISKVVKINQKDHAQGHICPDCKTWLHTGPTQIKKQAMQALLQENTKEQEEYYQATILVMEGVETFITRYRDFIKEMIVQEQLDSNHSLYQVLENCEALSKGPATTYFQAVQSLWFLFVILHMESNASSFSPGRIDTYLYPFYQKDIEEGILDKESALEILECFYIKCNQIVYLRSSHGAKYFAGFPIGFNIAIGGVDEKGDPFENDISYLCLEAQQHLGLPQPNLSLRIHEKTSQALLEKAIQVVSLGSGMPQFFNDKSVIPALIELGIEKQDALDYAIVGCVELTTQGNNLGWSDSAMFNFNKVLELTLNNGRCLITNQQLGLDLGNLTTYHSYQEIEEALKKQIDYFLIKMIDACKVIEKAHQKYLPSPFLSSVIQGCLEKGMDVTRGGAKYNLSGIQMIQIANLSDSLAVLKELVFEKQKISQKELYQAILDNYQGHEQTKAIIDHLGSRYGNDIEWVDELGANIAMYFKQQLSSYTNYRGGKYHTGIYTVSAHVPMGENVGASVDGRLSQTPLADGGMSPVYGRDTKGPTALLKSVARLDNSLTTNGGLLNMKFLPSFFDKSGIQKFSLLLRGFVDLQIPHVQFNVVNKEDLQKAQKRPELYKGLTIRVAGYTAYFVELDHKLQDEIMERTSYGSIE